MQVEAWFNKNKRVTVEELISMTVVIAVVGLWLWAIIQTVGKV